MQTPSYAPGVTHRDTLLDATRALAITMVVVAHGLNFFGDYPGAIIMMYEFGLLGVEIFFVLSGFLVGGIVYEQFAANQRVHEWLLKFLKRRWFRTLPNYFLFLIVAIAWERYYYGEFPNFLAYLFLLQNFAWEVQRLYMHSWSLPVEEFFYLIFPIMLLGVGRIKASANSNFFLACAVLFIASTTLRTFAATDPARTFNLGIREVVVYRLDSFMIGALAYVLYSRPHRLQQNFAFALGISLTTLSALAVAKVFGDLDDSFFWKVWWTPMTSLGIAGVLLGLIGRVSFKRRLAVPIESVARWSYSMYLSNSCIVILMLSLVPLGPTDSAGWRTLWFVIYVGITTAVSALIYSRFEKPITDLRERRPRPVGTVTTEATL